METQKDTTSYINKKTLLEWAMSCKEKTDKNFQLNPNKELAIKSDMWCIFISKIESL